ncbi:hypothetical protein IU427_10675 [Nocardia beijingensis]|uniref:hypothetical protein n=1 Tax=Nocardia beijingensis TaxID=95162 RepID=UPI0018933A9F|nr:hypothetical protein [Nocardia beijingensis]MBF6465635.1 hypothetical protein [Nocardia beijingensis]
MTGRSSCSTGKPCRLSLFDAGGTATTHAEGPITRIAPGKSGYTYTIAATFHHSLHLELRAPMQAGKSGEATVTLTLAGREPREVWRGIDLRHAIREAVTAQVHVDGIPYCTAQLDAAVPDEDQRSCRL